MGQVYPGVERLVMFPTTTFPERGHAAVPPGVSVHGCPFRAVLGALPASQREALTLAYYGGYTQREVAALTGTPLGTVKTRMLAGMRRLQQGLGPVAPHRLADDDGIAR